MDERTRQIGNNEAMFRAVNEEIETLNRGIAEISDKTMHIVCECGDPLCTEQLVVPIAEYERVRADSTLFFVVGGHEKPDIEEVVRSTESYDVLRKTSEEAARLAKQTDLRRPSAE